MPATRGTLLRPRGLPSTRLADVVVTDADAAGLVLAIDLVRHRVDVVLLAAAADAGFDAADFGASEFDAARGSDAAGVVALDVASQELLDDLGVLDRLIAAAGRFAAAGRPVAVMSDVRPLEVPHLALLSVLNDRLIELGGRVHRGHTYGGCQPDGARLDAYVGGPVGPITVRTRYLVRTDAADGAIEDDRRFAIGAAGDAGAALADVGVAGAAGPADAVNRRIQDAYNLGWKLAAVLGGGPEWIARTYRIERVAGQVSSLTQPCLRPRPAGGVGPGDRAPDARILSASGARTRLAALLHGPHWTLLGYGLEPAAPAAAGFAARAGLHVHTIGAFGDLVDIEGELQWAYGLSDGDRVLIRPDGLIAALTTAAEPARLREYLASVGLRRD